ncbi:hypothetical protein [Aestuariivivens sediminis]|uniref:hypothetical protein n=1 Tax=Aestuariivivens sediminis TaxID=2913557 RepID=UPI001F55D232|nr:hypothetical protein [Aestuariivivens sediminis]
MIHELMDIEHFYHEGEKALKNGDKEKAAMLFKASYEVYNNAESYVDLIPHIFIEKSDKAYENYLKLTRSNPPKKENKLKVFLKIFFGQKLS